MVEDPRKSNAKKHDLIEMLVVALLATLAGNSSCSSFAWYAKFKYEFLRTFMELKGGPPSHDPFSDLFNNLDPKQMATALAEFAKTLLATLPSHLVDQVAMGASHVFWRSLFLCFRASPDFGVRRVAIGRISARAAGAASLNIMKQWPLKRVCPADPGPPDVVLLAENPVMGKCN